MFIIVEILYNKYVASCNKLIIKKENITYCHTLYNKFSRIQLFDHYLNISLYNFLLKCSMFSIFSHICFPFKSVNSNHLSRWVIKNLLLQQKCFSHKRLENNFSNTFSNTLKIFRFYDFYSTNVWKESVAFTHTHNQTTATKVLA